MGEKSEIPLGWKRTKLGSICEFNYGKSLPNNNREHSGSFDVYGSNGIVGKHSKYLVDSPCIIVGRKGAAGEVQISMSPCWPIDTTYYILENPNYKLKFLYYLLKSLQLSALDKSTAIPGLNRNDAYEKHISLPPLAEQSRIVAKIEELFSNLDKGIERLKAAQQQLKIYRQSVLKWAFLGRFTNDDIKNKDLPESWKKISLGDCTYNFDGKRIPLSKEVRSKRKGTFPYYGATEIVDYIDDFKFDGKYLLIGEDGANLLSKSKPLAFIVEGKFWVNNHAHIMQTKNGFELAYLCHFINSLHLDDYVTGTAQPKLTQASMNKITIPIPPTQEEQRIIINEIDRRFAVCDKLENSINSSLEQSDALRQSILKKAFEGKLVPHQPQDEPASLLMEKIRIHETSQ